jgi:hypothetical protein
MVVQIIESSTMWFFASIATGAQLGRPFKPRLIVYFSWTYVSQCVVPKEQHDATLQNIVAVSQQRNELLKITGCLVFTGTRFAQIIEGSRSGIAELQRRIRADKRHTDVTTVEEEQAEKRRFSEWSLAYAGPSVLVSRTIEETLSRVNARDKLNVQNWVQLMEQFTSSTRH